MCVYVCICVNNRVKRCKTSRVSQGVWSKLSTVNLCEPTSLRSLCAIRSETEGWPEIGQRAAIREQRTESWKEDKSREEKKERSMGDK
jgi:hypothetical protein